MNAVVPEGQVKPIVEFKMQLDQREPEFARALPAHIPVERFTRIVMTAVQNNQGLLKVSRQSFFNSCMRAAQDGLLPDGREGAIVEFGGNAQWMPMIGGIRKKVRNSGEIATWEAHIVYEHDEFLYELGDEPVLRHKPTMADRGKPIAAYSIAVLKSGEKSREVMTVAEIEKVRAVSRAKNNGPWVAWWDEMARKTVARRHSKVLPMSTDLDDLLRRDDDLYDMAGASDAEVKARRPGLHAALDRIGNGNADPAGGLGDGVVEDAENAADQSTEASKKKKTSTAEQKTAITPLAQFVVDIDAATTPAALEAVRDAFAAGPMKSMADGDKAKAEGQYKRRLAEIAPAPKEAVRAESGAPIDDTDAIALVEKYEKDFAEAADTAAVDRLQESLADLMDELSQPLRIRLQNAHEAATARLDGGVPDPHAALKDMARVKAGNGSKRFNLWWRTLKPADQEALEPIGDELAALGDSADAQLAATPNAG